MRLLTTLAVTAGTAAADHQSFNSAAEPCDDGSPITQQVSASQLPWNQQPQTEERYQLRNKLADVRLDSFRHRAIIQLPAQRGIDYLELRAGRAPVMLNDVIVRFANGTEIHTGSRGLVEPFEGRVIDLPRNSSPVVALIPVYQATSRFGGQLEVFGVPEHRFNRFETSSYRRW